jgi:hypothetical protein
MQNTLESKDRELEELRAKVQLLEFSMQHAKGQFDATAST